MNIEKVRLTKENLEVIKSIDDTFYKDSRLTLNWYLRRYNENHYGFLLKNNDDQYVGYMVYVPIKKNLYDQFVEGKLADDVEIDTSMIVRNSKFIYIVSIVILEQYRKKGYGTKMLNMLFQSITNKNFCAISVSEAGYKLLKKKLHITKKVNEKVYAFEKKCLE